MSRWLVWPATATLLLTACTGTGDEAEELEPAPSTSAATTPSAPAPAPAPPEQSEQSDARDGRDRSGVARISFVGAEPIGPEDAAAVAAGEVPAALRVLDEDTEPVLRTSPVCRSTELRTVEVPVRRNGLLRLRETAGVVGALTARVGDQLAGAGPRDVVVLAPRTDLAVLLVRDADGAVLARTAAEQIDERWFVGEVEVCQGGADS